MKQTNLTKSRLTDELNRNEVYKGKKPPSCNFSVKIWLRGNQLNSRNSTPKKLPVYIEIGYGKKKKAISTGIFVYPDQLDTENLKIIGDPEKNILLQSYISKAQQFYTELKITERPIDLALIIAAIFGYATLSAPTLVKLFDLYFEQCEKRCKVGDRMAPSTLRKIKVWNNRIKEFIVSRYGSNAPISVVVPNDVTEFVLFLKGECDYSHNSSMMACSHFKRVLSFAVANAYVTVNSFGNFRRNFEIKKVESLTEEELDTLENLKLMDERLRRTLDVFLYQIYTGLSYTDCQHLRKSNIYELATGELYIFIERQKTRKTQTVMLNRKALEILAKYEDDKYCKNYGFVVPVLSNQKMNTSLKAIQAIAGIEQKLTTHLGRKTFATLLYNAGATEKTMRAIMGHSNISQTLKAYAKISQKAVVLGMKETFRNSKLGS
jgi:integrase